MSVIIKPSNTYKVMNGIVITMVKGLETKENMMEKYFQANNIKEIKEGLKESINYNGEYLYLQYAELYLVYKAENEKDEFLEKVGTFFTNKKKGNLDITINLE